MKEHANITIITKRLFKRILYVSCMILMATVLNAPLEVYLKMEYAKKLLNNAIIGTRILENVKNVVKVSLYKMESVFLDLF